MPRQSNTQSLSDIIAEIVGTIATDVRQHVAEEPWFGRVVTPDWTATDQARTANSVTSREAPPVSNEMDR